MNLTETLATLSFWLTVRLPTLLAIWWRTQLRPTPSAEVAPAGLRSYIVFRLDGLGDLVLTTPLLRELKRMHPGARCTVVVHDAMRSLLVTNPHVDRILSLPLISAGWLPQRLRKLVSAILFYRRSLRGAHYDLAISPRWDTDEDLATLLCVLTEVNRRIGYSETASSAKRRFNRGFDRAFTQCLPPGPTQHELRRNLAVVEALGGKVNDRSLEIWLSDQDRQSVLGWWPSLPSDGVVIALCVGARHPSRKWPLASFVELIRRLSKDRYVQPIVLCSWSEWAEAKQLAQQLGSHTIIAGGRRLRETCAVLERCHLFIGNDSGCAHLAAAMNCKTLVISRHPRDGDPDHSNSPLRFAPACSVASVLQPATGLGSCRTGCNSQQPHCITQITVEQVVVAARLMLRGPVPPGNLTWDEKRFRSTTNKSAFQSLYQGTVSAAPVPGGIGALAAGESK